jgi:hypothetical protein
VPGLTIQSRMVDAMALAIKSWGDVDRGIPPRQQLDQRSSAPVMCLTDAIDAFVAEISTQKGVAFAEKPRRQRSSRMFIAINQHGQKFRLEFQIVKGLIDGVIITATVPLQDLPILRAAAVALNKNTGQMAEIRHRGVWRERFRLPGKRISAYY